MHAGRPNWRHAAPWCPKYDTRNSTQPTIYERLGGATYARDVLELRTWKALRALEVCQVALRLLLLAEASSCSSVCSTTAGSLLLQRHSWNGNLAIELSTVLKVSPDA